MTYKKDQGRIPDWIEGIAKWGIMIGATLAIIFAFVFFFMMLYSVPVGEAALLVDPLSQTVSEPVFGPTFGVKMPWVNMVWIYYATDVFEDEIPCFSADQMEMQIQVLIRWSLDPGKIRGLYHNYPHVNYKEKTIESIMEETIRLVTKNYTTLETIEHRDVVVHRIEQAVFKEIKEEVSLVGAMIHLEMDVKNIAYPPKYTAAIEDKLVSEQQQIQAEFERQRIIIMANATAQEMVIKAEGEANAKILVAQGTKQAIQMILEASGGNPGNSTRIAELYLWVETLKGIAPDIDLFLMSTGEDGIPILIPLNQTK